MDIDITISERKTLLFLINAFLPGTTVWAYGSRVKFTSKPESDLDLAAFINPGQQDDLAELKNASAESELPFKVDILDWNTIPENFKQNIHQQYVVLQDANADKTSILSNWKTYKIDDLAELRKDIFSPKGEDWPYIGLEHIDQQSLRLNSIGNAKNIVSNKYHFLPGDILFGKLRPYFRKVFHPNFEGVCSTDIFVIKNRKPVTNEFLFYLVATEEFTSLANSGSTGTHMPRADWAQIKKSKWAVPNSLTEQQSIASILSSLDDKIELNRQMNQTLENLAQSIFKEWFVNFNFPGFDGELVSGLPKGWKIGNIYELIEVVYGFPFKSALFNQSNDGTGLIRIRDLKNNSTGFFTTEQADSKYLVKAGDILAGMDAEFVPTIWLGKSSWLNQRVCRFKPKHDYVNELYILYTLKPLLERSQYGKVGTTVIHLGKSDIDQYQILIPEKKILRKVSEIFTVLHKRLVQIEFENRSLAATRENLLPNLIAGKIKINA